MKDNSKLLAEICKDVISEMVENGLAGIDEILVVTFTTAAAAQMKEKIIKSLEEKS